MATKKYGAKASEKVEKALHERKAGTLKSGGSGKKVTSRKQAIAIGLSEAREAGGKVPPPKKAAKKSAKKATGRKTAAKKAAARKSSAGKTSTKKTSAKKTTAKKAAPRKTAKKATKKAAKKSR